MAISAVLVFHSGWTWLPGGFLGVDVFFVLSGFLITTLLLEEHFRSGQISLSAFFFRRIVRLYPALIGLVVVSTVFTLAFHQETAVPRTLSIAASVLLYYANWLSMADTAGWFGGMPHTWSLAIEAQFYVIWALLIAGISRRYARPQERGSVLRILTIISMAVVIVSACWRAALWANGAEWLRTYLGTDTRLDSVFIGATAALLRLQGVTLSRASSTHREDFWGISLLTAICVATIAYLLFTIHFGSALPGQIAFVIVSISTAVLILAVLQRPHIWCGALLRWGPLVWLGEISYSLYIWHVPAAKLLKTKRLIAAGLPEWGAHGVRLFATVVIATASYYLIERTFLRWRHRANSTVTANGTRA